jgi:hypothetical protein
VACSRGVAGGAFGGVPSRQNDGSLSTSAFSASYDVTHSTAVTVHGIASSPVGFGWTLVAKSVASPRP